MMNIIMDYLSVDMPELMIPIKISLRITDRKEATEPRVTIG